MTGWRQSDPSTLLKRVRKQGITDNEACAKHFARDKELSSPN